MSAEVLFIVSGIAIGPAAGRSEQRPYDGVVDHLRYFAVGVRQGKCS